MTWARTWLASFNPKNTESFLISCKLNKPVYPPHIMDNQVILEVDSHKHLYRCISSQRLYLANAYLLCQVKSLRYNKCHEMVEVLS